jgi:hypothetical protein
MASQTPDTEEESVFPILSDLICGMLNDSEHAVSAAAKTAMIQVDDSYLVPCLVSELEASGNPGPLLACLGEIARSPRSYTANRDVIEALGQCGHADAVAILLGMLPKGGRNSAVVHALGESRHPMAVKSLIDALSLHIPTHVEAIATALGHIGDKSAAPALFDAFRRGNNISTERAICEAIAKIGEAPDDLGPFLSRLERTREHYRKSKSDPDPSLKLNRHGAIFSCLTDVLNHHHLEALLSFANDRRRARPAIFLIEEVLNRHATMASPAVLKKLSVLPAAVQVVDVSETWEHYDGYTTCSDSQHELEVPTGEVRTLASRELHRRQLA